MADSPQTSPGAGTRDEPGARLGDGERTGRCPICRKPSAARAANEREKSPCPFCSERCRLIDLGRWLDGVYQIPAAEDAPQDDESSEE